MYKNQTTLSQISVNEPTYNFNMLTKIFSFYGRLNLYAR